MLPRLFQLKLLLKESTPTPTIRRREKTNLKKEKEDLILRGIWLHIRKVYFPDRADLDSYEIRWSPRRQRRVLASCCISKQRVVVARELNRAEHARWLPALIYHEMCHAFFGDRVEKNANRRLWHGPEFRALEQRHPEIKDLDHWIRSGGWHKAVLSDRERRRCQPFTSTRS